MPNYANNLGSRPIFAINFPPISGGTGTILHYLLWLSRKFWKKVTQTLFAQQLRGFCALLLRFLKVIPSGE